MKKMRIAICDDEPLMQKELKEEIDAYFHSLDVLTTCYSSGAQLLAAFEKIKYDAVFLDIEMDGLNGLQVAKCLHEKKKDLPIVLVTTHTELAMEGYEVAAFRFLAKPVDRKKIQHTLSAIERMLSEDDKLCIVSDGLQRYLPCKSVCYIKSENVYLELITEKENYLIRQKLKDLYKQLPKNSFIQVHRSFIVNLRYVESFDGSNVCLENGVKIPVSKANREAFKTAMIHYMKRND